MAERLLLVGMMGAGKSTAGRLAARRLGWTWVDIDAEIVRDGGASVPELFARHGEAHFRQEEIRVLGAVLDRNEPLVVSVGEGRSSTRPTAPTLRDGGTVVWLRARPETLIRRVHDGAGRPLLAGDTAEDRAEALRRIEAERRPLYAEVADEIIDVDRLRTDKVAERLLESVGQDSSDAPVGSVIAVPVALGARAYDVLVGRGILGELATVLPAGVQRVAVVTQEGIDVDIDAGVPTDVFLVPNGEGAKTVAQVEELCRGFADIGLSRSDAVVAVGGGVVSDLAGFAAAVFHRGVPYVTVATTLLAQVDAAIGGKTGVNLPQGKNLVGAFWQPSAVLCDVDVLSTLPAREWASGRGEMAKYAFLGETLPGVPGMSLLDLGLEEQVARCVAIKAAVVASDERESDRRMVLNYGHTLAHALEAEAFGADARWDLRHGEAVAVGLVFAALLAKRMERIDDARVALHRKVVTGFDLPVDLPAGASAEQLMSFMARDKKARHDLTFVLDGPERGRAGPRGRRRDRPGHPDRNGFGTVTGTRR